MALTTTPRRVVRPADLTKAARDGMLQHKALLSLDGGGVRGLMTAIVLERLEATIKKVIVAERLLETSGSGSSSISPQDFDIELADYFNMLAGTSTGGLLALYLGSRGKSGDNPDGSAAGARDIYERYSTTIFAAGWRRWATLIGSGFEYAHTADGLRSVLKTVLGDKKTLADLTTDTVITSVDATNMRSAIFFRMGPGNGDGYGTGFGTYARQTVGKPALDIYCAEVRDRSADELSLGMELVSKEAALDIEARGGWLAPFTFFRGDFKIGSVARATSAAPAYLPPCKAGASTRDTGGEITPEQETALWESSAVFVDGGISNNDPSTMGLSLMLLRFPTLSVRKTAILSIGCGVAVDCPDYKHGLSLVGMLPQVVGLAMNTNAEDKSNFMRLIYNGLLQLPRDQYMRVQLYTRQVNGDIEKGLHLTEAEKAALNAMDDPSATALGAYTKAGDFLADRYEARMEAFVKRFIFGLP